MRYALSLAALTLMAFAAHAEAGEAPSSVWARRIDYAGSGCPAGSVAANVAADRQAFTLFFDDYVAEVGPNAAYADKRKNCQLTIDLQYPAGWSFTIATFDYRGYASLEAGVEGLQKVTYYFQGDGNEAVKETPFYGPAEKDYQVRDALPLADAVWSPCGATRALNVNTQIRLDNSRSPWAAGVLTTDSVDGTFKTVLGLKWRRC